MDAGQDRVGVARRSLPGALVLELSGELDFGNADQAGDALRRTSAEVLEAAEAAVAAAPPLVVLDLRGVGFLSAAGVHALYGFAAECAARGVRIRIVVEPEGIIERVARLAELDRRIPLFTALSEALCTAAAP